MSEIGNAGQLREAIAETLWAAISAHDLAAACVALGLDPQNETEQDPFLSKRGYVRRRIIGMTADQLVTLADEVVERWGSSDELDAALAAFSTRGVDGELKNLIFAADGPKPRIVMRDAINNVIEIVENAEHCLVYDRPLPSAGLTWGELAQWWAQHEGVTGSTDNERALYARLRASLSPDSPGERVLFDTYGKRYAGQAREQVPALIPQVYLHYDPYTRRELAAGPGQTLVRQRMDFLLLLPGRQRVVIEVDGKQHYADGDTASPARYAEMVREDRALRLAGYEVYRFGGLELSRADAEQCVEAFFAALLDAEAS